MEVVPHVRSTVASLMATSHGRTELSIAKKVHRFTHAHSDEMKALYRTAGLLTPELADAFDQVHTACAIWKT